MRECATFKMPAEVIQGFWQRQPGIDLCVKECGAYCCRKGLETTLDEHEVNRLNSKLLGGMKINARFDKTIRRYRWNIGKPCVFLLSDSKCLIHDERPEACRRFPTRPKDWCAVWPLKK
jgi:Fe-S-cluster containining protein